MSIFEDIAFSKFDSVSTLYALQQEEPYEGVQQPIYGNAKDQQFEIENADYGYPYDELMGQESTGIESNTINSGNLTQSPAQVFTTESDKTIEELNEEFAQQPISTDVSLDDLKNELDKRLPLYGLEPNDYQAEVCKKIKIDETGSKKTSGGSKRHYDAEEVIEGEAHGKKRITMSKNYKGVTTTGFIESLRKNPDLREALFDYAKQFRVANPFLWSFTETSFCKEVLDYAESNIGGKEVTKGKKGKDVDSYRVGNTKQIKAVFYPEEATPLVQAVATVLTLSIL